MQTDVLYIFASVAFFIWVVRSLVFWLSWWQRRQSQQPELKTTLRSSLPHLFSISAWLTWFSIIILFIISLNDYPTFYTQIIVFGILFLKILIVVINVMRKGIKRFDVTFQEILIFILAFLLTAVIFSFPLTEKYLWILLIDRILFFIILGVMFLVTFPLEIINDITFFRTKQSLRKYKQVKTIFILGDNAEETASFAYQLLARSFKVVLVNDTYFRPGVIASRLSRAITKETDIVLLPITEYNKTKVNTLSQLVSPTILIWGKCSISPVSILSHLSKILPSKTLIIHDKGYSSQIAVYWKKKKSISFGVDGENQDKGVVASDIKQKKDGIRFDVQLKTKTLSLTVPLIGAHTVYDLLPGIILADYLGIPGKAISDALLSLSPVPANLVPHKLRSGVVLLDGSGTPSLSLMQEGLEYMRLFHKHKSVILGLSKELNKKDLFQLGKVISETADTVIVLNEKDQSLLRKALKIGTGKSKILTKKTKDMNNYIRYELEKGDIVLFLGQETEPILTDLLRRTQTEE